MYIPYTLADLQAAREDTKRACIEAIRDWIDTEETSGQDFCSGMGEAIRVIAALGPIETRAEIEEKAAKIAADNIRAEIANGGTSCHWCIDATRAKERERCVEVLEKVMAEAKDDFLSLDVAIDAIRTFEGKEDGK